MKIVAFRCIKLTSYVTLINYFKGVKWSDTYQIKNQSCWQ